MMTGEVVAEFGTTGQPDGTLLIACKDRRAAVCPACAEVYRADTWHVVAAGLRGRELGEIRPGLRGQVAGAAVPASVVTHPVVLATFTAPSFGATHSSHGKACRPRRDRPMCRHGAPAWCGRVHESGDRWVGTALCADCYDYPGHVLWHAALPELWKTTVTYLYRALARAVSERRGERVTVADIRRRWLRVSFVKVAEWQQRAIVHLHVVMRLDGVNADDRAAIVAPPGWADVRLLETAIRDAGARAVVGLPEVGHRKRSARWGVQLDVSPITAPERAAAYVAKYATKSAGDTVPGLPATPFAVADLTGLMRRRGVSAHVGLLVLACHELDRLPECGGFRLAKHAHTLGYGGHFATKSRSYSTTLGALRAARRCWRAAGRDGDVWAGTGTAVVGSWRLAGVGFASSADTALAATLARDHAAERQARRDGLGGDDDAAA